MRPTKKYTVTVFLRQKSPIYGNSLQLASSCPRAYVLCVRRINISWVFYGNSNTDEMVVPLPLMDSACSLR